MCSTPCMSKLGCPLRRASMAFESWMAKKSASVFRNDRDRSIFY